MNIKAHISGNRFPINRAVVTVFALGGLLIATAAIATETKVAAVTVNVAMSQKIYQPNSPVKSRITVTNPNGKSHEKDHEEDEDHGEGLKGVLRVVTFNEQTRTQIDVRKYRVTIPAHGSRVVPYVIAPTPEPNASYRVQASFVVREDEKAVTAGTGSGRFGVRSADFPEGVPDNVLKADVVELDVKKIQMQLKACTKTKKPVHINIGERDFGVQVAPLELLAPGVQIPGLGRPPIYRGKVVDDKGQVKEDSQVVLSIANGELQGSIDDGQVPAEGAPLPEGVKVQDSLWIQPLREFQLNQKDSAVRAAATQTAASTYITYRQKDTLPPPEGSHGPGPIVLEENPQSPLLEAAPGVSQAPLLAAAAAVPIQNYKLRLRVVSDSSSTSEYRFQRVVEWAASMYHYYDTDAGVPKKLASRFDTPLQVQLRSISSTDPAILVTQWKAMANDTFTGTCKADIDFFISAVERGALFGGNEEHVINVAFTNNLPDCGGIATRGAVAATGDTAQNRGYVLASTKGNNGESWDTIILMQEIGHVLDSHPNRFFYDAHTAPQIAERILIDHIFWSEVACNAMNASYSPCQVAYPVYTFSSSPSQSSVLQYLAVGVTKVGTAR